MAPSSTTPAGELRVFVARMGMLHQTRAFVEDFCARRDLARDDALRLSLIVEELFTNTILHGYGRECDEPIAITLLAEGGRAGIVYEDAAGPYDPLATLATEVRELALPMEERPIGHIGVRLVAGLAEEARYAYEGGRNRLTLMLRTGA